jgi:hypothetical protein
VPAPPDLTTLATRIGVRSSVGRCLDGLDAFALRVLEGCLLKSGPLDFAGLAAQFDVAVSGVDVAAAVDRLTDRALLWGDPAQPHVLPAVVELIGSYPAGLGEPAALLRQDESPVGLTRALGALGMAVVEPAGASQEPLADEGAVRSLLERADSDQRHLLESLAAGPPVGRVDAATAAAMNAGVQGGNAAVLELLEAGLVIQVAADAVELPREVGLLLRNGRALGRVEPLPPDGYESIRPVGDVDATASVAVLELLRLVESLIDRWDDEPPPQLRSGGLAVRDFRRTARELGLTESTAALVVELAVAADLIGAPTGREVPWRPTTDFDTWRQRDPAQRWLRLAQAWRTMTRQPHLVGERDERGKARAALSYEVERSAAPAIRADVLRVLIEAPEGAAGPTTRLLDRLAWLMPRRFQAQQEAMVAVLREAEFIGMTGAGGLSTFGRAVATAQTGNATSALLAALPAPVDEFLLQPDLTAVVPGPPTPDLARELALLADLESAGGASVYRITEASLRRSFDAGRSAAELHTLLTSRSRTPVPQALTYLVDDLARRYGVLRAGDAVGYLRCDDIGLLDRVLTDRAVNSLGWHRLAPTVAVTANSTDRVLDTLRAVGYAPAPEDRFGLAITRGAERARARPRQADSARVVPAPAARDDQFLEAIRRARVGDEMARTAHPVTVTPDIPGVTSATTLGVLRDAIRTDRRVWVSYVDSAGTSATVILEPLSLGGGFLRGHDDESGEFRSLQLHRITSVNVLAD